MANVPTTYKGQTLTYDAENRLTGYGSVLTAGYNGDDKRAWKQTSAGTILLTWKRLAATFDQTPCEHCKGDNLISS